MPLSRQIATATLLAGALLAALAAPGAAQDKVDRTVLQRSELAGEPPRVMVLTELTADPGARIPRHTHPGTEMVYVLSAGRTRTDAGETRTLSPGQTQRFARDEVHGGFTVIGETPVRVLTMHVVDADKPMTTVVE